MKTNVRQRLFEMLNNRKAPAQAFADIRDKSDIGDLDAALKEIKAKGAHFLQSCWGVIHATKYTELHSVDEKGGISPGTIKGELNLLLIVLRENASKIGDFIAKRSEFDGHLIKAEFTEAYKLLENIKLQHGVSLWSLEQEFVLFQLCYGLEQNKNFLAKIDRTHSDLTRAIGRLISIRIEPHVGWERFREESMLIAEKNKHAPHHVAYTLFKANFINGPIDSRVAGILHWSNTASYVDRYLTLLSLAKVSKAHGARHASVLIDVCKRLSPIISDPILHQIVASIDSSHEPLVNHVTSDVIKLRDLALEKKWEELKLESARVIEKWPSVFDGYEMYALAYQWTGGQLPDLHQPIKSIKEAITSALLHVEARAATLDKALVVLKKASMLLGHRAISYKLDYYWSRYRRFGVEMVDSSIAQHASNCATPHLVLTYASRRDAEKHIQFWRKQFPTSSYISELEYLYSDKLMLGGSLGIEKESNILNETLRFIIRKDFQRVAALVKEYVSESVTLDLTSKSIFKDDLFQYILEALFFTNDGSLALDLLVDALLNHKISVRELTPNIVQSTNSPSVGMSANASLPIFRALYGESVTKIYVAYANLMDSVKIERPSQLRQEHGITGERLIQFWHKSCTYEVLEKSTSFDSSDEAELERIALLKELQSIDPNNAKTYSEEQVKIRQRRSIREGVRQIDESKIYINLEGLKDAFSKTWQEKFYRFSDYKHFKNLLPLLQAAASAGVFELDEAVNSQRGKMDEMREVLFQLFCKIYADIKSQFLHNPLYGLNAGLSTRIRHGIIVRNIRSIFEAERLIVASSSTPSNSEHFLQSFKKNWPDVNTSPEVLNSFSSFSEEIDRIAVAIRDVNIQIEEGEVSSERMFNYVFSEDQMYDVFLRIISIKEYDSFIEVIFESLLQRTEGCLNAIRDHLKNQQTVGFYNLLDKFSENLRRDNLSHDLDGIPHQISACRASISGSIEKICGWFHLSKESAILDGEISLACEIAFKMIESEEARSKAKFVYKCDGGVLIFGHLFPSFVYMLYQLLENAVKYSDSELHPSDVITEIRYSNGELEVATTNCCKKGNAKAYASKISETIAKMRSNNVERGSGEGGTGIAKVLNIIEGDFRREGYKMYSEAVDERQVKVSVGFSGVKIVLKS